ncbi:MAG: CHC2 zinc finger domain-containing protein [bacterium]
MSDEQWLELEREWSEDLSKTDKIDFDISVLKDLDIIDSKIRELDEIISKVKDIIEDLIRKISKLTEDEQILCNAILKNTHVKDLVCLGNQRSRFMRYKHRLSPHRNVRSGYLDVESAVSHSLLSVVEHDTRLRRSGKNFVGRCPLHDDRSPSFYTYPESNSFYCFGCKQGGNTINYVMQKEGLDFKSAVQFINNL